MNAFDLIRRHATVARLPALLVCALASATAWAAPSDNFESYAPGAFPSPTWSDFGSFFPSDPNYLPPASPSVTVVQTTDAFGHPTQVAQTVDAGPGPLNGLYALQPQSMLLSVSADVRIVRYSDSDPTLVPAWRDAGASVQFFTADPTNAPFLSLYASSTTHGWRLGYSGDATISPDLDDYDLGTAAQLNTWYHVQLQLDRQTGAFDTQITDIAAGTTFADHVVQPGWQSGFDNFDAVLFSSYEGSATLPLGPGKPTYSNIGQYDNINLGPVPEPQTAALMTIGLSALLLCVRGKRLGA